jgi:transcription antitermination factor NusG
MRLDQALVQRGACGSRTEAAELIEIGAVFVNNEQITKKTKKISDSDAIELTQKRKFVSRGGHKLENALLHVYGTDEAAIVKIKGLEALDVGSSTGGFTDCLLSYMVRSVTCVDVGTNQLHTKLRNTPNVTGFLGAGTVPVPVRGEELEQLKGILTEKSEEYKTDMQIGDYVTVKNGPFEGSEGKIIEVNTAK